MAINERATVEVQVNGQQAKQELRDLESYANSLKGRLAEAYKAGDTKQIKKLEAELKKTNAELKTMRTNAKNIDSAMQNLSLAGPKELRQLLKDINAKLNSGHIKRGSAEWKMYQERLKLVNAELRKINAEVQETQSWLTRFNNGFSKWGGLLASGAAAITGVSFALSKLRNNRDDKEDSAANLKALTGLDDKSIQWLTRQAEILSTTMDKTGLRVTQSSKEILEAYMLVGSAKPELLSNKEALNSVTVEAMRLSTAAKMNLKEAVDAVTLSMNQYGASANDAAKYTNVMAAGSKFGSAAVQSITAAVTKAGVSASGANVSIEELVGTIETLAEKGIKDEVAGTGLRMFFLRLQTGADETNPKIVGLQTALSNLQKLSVDEVIKRFGTETYTVAKTLIDGADKVDYYTKAVTGTSVAMEQAAINSDTAKAKRAQYINQIKEAGNTLMERLNPSLSVLTGWTTKLIKAAPILIDFLKEYGSTIMWCSAAILIYTTRLKIVATWHAVVNGLTRTATILTGAYKLANIALSDALAGDCKAMARFVTQMASTNVATRIVAASTLLYRAAIELLTLRFKGAATALKGFWSVLGINPITALVAAVAGAVAISYKWNKSIRERYDLQKTLNKVEQDAQKLYDQEKTKVKKLWEAIHDNNKSLDDRRKAILELQKIMPDYRAQITEEGKVINETTTSLDKMNDMLLLNMKLQTLRTELVERYKAIEELEKSPALKDTSLMGAMAREDVREKLAAERKVLEGLKNEYKELYIQKIKATNPVKGKTNNSNDDDKKKCPKCGNYPCTCRKDPKPENNKLLAEEKRYQNELKQLKEQYLSSNTMTQKEYQDFLTDLELKHLDRKLDIAGLESEKREEIEKRVLDIQMKFKEKCLAEDKDEKKQFLSNQQKALNVELAEESRRYKLGYMSREEYLQSILQLLTKYKIGVQKITENATGEEKEAVDSYIEYVMKALQKAFDQTEEKNKTWQDKVKDNWTEIGKWSEMSTEQQSSMLSSLLIDIFNFRDGSMSAFETVEEKFEATFMFMSGIAQDFGVSLGKTLTGEEEAMGEFLQNLIVMVLDTIEKMLIAYISMTTIRNVGELGIWGLAKAAGEIALITAAFETAKSAIGNFYTGGFTSPGEWDKPQGIVHSNEFVANRFAVANPEILPVLKLIDTAQKNNTVGKLTSQDVSSVLRSGGQNQAAAVEIIQTTDPEIKMLIAECTTVMQSVKKRFEKRIVAETYITGKRGINEALSDYDKLMKNVKRG
nr:MAG TPA: tail tape measure protein [Caudoviricetes sp.]